MISRFWVLRISCRFVSGTSAAKLTSNSLVTTIVSLMPDRERTGNDCLTKGWAIDRLVIKSRALLSSGGMLMRARFVPIGVTVRLVPLTDTDFWSSVSNFR